jgi:hypothetical protein
VIRVEAEDHRILGINNDAMGPITGHDLSDVHLRPSGSQLIDE